MGELERDSRSDDDACERSDEPFGRPHEVARERRHHVAQEPEDAARKRLAIVGRGRLGKALAAALEPVGYGIWGPLGRDSDTTGADAVLLCVPDVEIARAAAKLAPGSLVGHCSGATGLDVLAPHEAFSFHPLMTVTREDAMTVTRENAMTVSVEGAPFAGAGAAIAGSTARALTFASELASALSMNAVVIDDADRAAYHAAASIASNLLITLEAAAERVAATAGVDRALLVPLVRATVQNWAALGPERALTGPVARGDEATVARQRAAIAERAEDLLPLFDTMVRATRALAAAASERPRVSSTQVPAAASSLRARA
jgi:predicted short-subunit dehydrogenase-like oxidoreductase (DUF2520 family)